MSNPTVVSVTPGPNATDVVLGGSIIITFSTQMDTDSINNATFALTAPGYSSIVSPDQLVEKSPAPLTGQGYVLGNFAFSTKTFQPWIPFHAYHVNDQVVDGNGNVQTCTEAGTSAPYAPTWNQITGQSTTDNNLPGWQAGQTLSFGQYILDPNGNLQKVTVSVGGTTGSQPPQWNRTTNGTTFDGSIIWTCYGAFNPTVWENGGVANNGQTVVTFTPVKPLRPGIAYTCLIVGTDSTLANTYIQDISGNPLLNSFQWSFNTGTLNVNVPPVQNPLPPVQTTLRMEQIQVVPRAPVGVGDPSVQNLQIIELIFPAPIDTNTFDPSGVLVGVEPIMNDPDVMVPPGANATYVVQGNKMIVTVTGV